MRYLDYYAQCEAQCDIHTEHSFSVGLDHSPEMIHEQICDGLVCPYCGGDSEILSILLATENGEINLLKPEETTL